MQANLNASDHDVLLSVQHEWQKSVEENKKLTKELGQVREKLRFIRLQRTLWLAGLAATVVISVVQRLGS